MSPSERPVVAVTGAGGFIGRNLCVRLQEAGLTVWGLSRQTPEDAAARRLAEADVVVHLAGAVRPQDPSEFDKTNAYAAWMAELIALGGRKPLIICASSVRADDDTLYGASKRTAEQLLTHLAARGQARAAVYRLPHVFGKWCRPNYNSCVATFCHNLARGLPIRIDDPEAPLSLLYVDDLIDQWLELILHQPKAEGYLQALGVQPTTVGHVAQTIRAFAAGRGTGEIEAVGEGLSRALYATFVAALPVEAFSYPLEVHTDPRGSFTEVLKTPASGQFSFFTAHPGVTRGGHYHHSKVEKFLIVQGKALFRFRHILTGDLHEVRTCAETPVVVETIPGWTHDVTNIGEGTMVSLLWASEVFDRARPDTVTDPV